MKKLVGKIIDETQRDVKNYPFIFVIGGILFLLGGMAQIAINISFMNRIVAAEGTVVEISYQPHVPIFDQDNKEYDESYIIEFRTTEGQSITFQDGNVNVSIGDKVKVLYYPSKPSDARIYTVSNFWVWPTLMALVGAMIFIMGLWGWISKRKSQREPRLM
jgi:hypothetical protein